MSELVFYGNTEITGILRNIRTYKVRKCPEYIHVGACL